jgi:serine/threonine-protein kinase
MAPEQYRGGGVDHRGDLFAAGVILYELLTGRLPFDGDSIAEVGYKISHVPHTPAREIRAEVPAAVDLVLAQALAKEKEVRFQSALEFSRAVEAALRASAPSFGPGSIAGAFDHTVLGVPPPAPSSGASLSAGPPSTGAIPGSLTPEAHDRIVRALAKHVGPIAKVMVKKAAANVDSYRDLCLALSSRLPEAERSEFLRDVGVG